MPRVEVTRDERDKDVDRLEDLFHRVHEKDKDAPKTQHIDSNVEVLGTLQYVKSVAPEKLGEYGLELPEWADEVTNFAIWRRVATGAYELRRPNPTAYTPTSRAGQNAFERVANVDQTVYFDHLPECAERGRISFPNARAAREYVQRVHNIDLNM